MILQEMFSRVLNMSITATIIILVILAVRMLLRRAPKIFSYALWAVVLFRLLCPVSVESEFSVLGVLGASTGENGSVEYIAEQAREDLQISTQGPETEGILQMPEVLGTEQLQDSEGKVYAEKAPENGTNALVSASVTAQQSVVFDTGVQKQEQPDSGLSVHGVFAAIWVVGMAALVAYSVWRLARLKNKLGVSQCLQNNIYLADYISTAFVIGVVRPKIYLPSGLLEREQSYIILHEKHHIRRGDHLWKMLAFVALCLHWFNPFVWLAFVLSSKDMEMSCDEAVMKRLKTDIRAEYSESLLHFATGRRLFAGMPLAFGEGDTKQRVKNVMHYKKPALWVVLIAVLVCIVVGVCLITNPKKVEQGNPFGKNDVVEDMAYDIAVGAKFESDACLYMTPLSSYFPIGGNSGFTYEITEDAFLKISKDKINGTVTTLPVESWGWQEFPFTDEEWASFTFAGVGAQESISSIYKEMLYQPLSGREFLLRMDGKIWLVDMHSDGYFWSIYSLKPIPENGSENGQDGDAVPEQPIALAPEEYTLLPDRTYRSSEVIQYAYDTYITPFDGDSGYLYSIQEDRFVFINKVYGDEESLPVESWEWQEFPYEREYWEKIAAPQMVELYDKCEEILYLPLSKDYYLLLADDILLLVESDEFREYSDYVGDVYTLVPADWEEDTHLVQKAYEKYYAECPEAAYSVADWLGPDGIIGFPFDWRDTLEMSNPEREVIYYVPQEALDRATTEDLVELLVGYDHRSRFDIYNFISYYWDYVLNNFNVAEELISRESLAEDVLKAYQKDNFLIKSSFGDAAKQKAYDEQCYDQFNKIGLEEIILATNLAFDQMDDEMRKATIEEALNKVEERLSGKFKCSYGLANGEDGFGEMPSGFFAYIVEMEESTGSKWYRFMQENGYDELVEKLDGLNVRDCWPQ